MAVRLPPSFLAYEEVEHTARNDRLTIGAGFTPGPDPLSGRSGVLVGPPGSQGELSLPDQTIIRVGPGIFVLQGAVDAAQGQYTVINDGDYDQLINVTQHASEFRRVAVVMGVTDSVMAGLDVTPATDPDTGDPVPYDTALNGADVYLIAGDLSPAAPGPNPAITTDVLQAWAVLGWINVPPAGQTITVTPNPAAVVGSRTGILPGVAGDETPGSHPYAYRHQPGVGLEWWDGSAWQSLQTWQMNAVSLRLTSTTDAGPASTGHALQIGPTSGNNIIADSNEIQARNAGAVAPLYLSRPALGASGEQWDLAATSTPGSALITKDHLTAALARTTATTLRLTATADATPTSTGHALQIGPDDGINLRLDNNELVGSDGNGHLSPIFLTNPEVSAETWVLGASSTPDAALITKGYVAPALADTGWVNFVPSSGWAVSSGDGGCKLRIKAGVVYIRFACTRASWGAGQNLVTLSSTYRPTIDQTFTGHWGGYHEVVLHNDTGVMELPVAGSGGLYLSCSWPLG